MSRKSAHPDLHLFDYLSGALDPTAAREVRQHLDDCEDCASVIDIVSAMKSLVSDLRFETSDRHPDVREIARFFYGKQRNESRATAAHVAVCRSCTNDLAEYARAERATSSRSTSSRSTSSHNTAAPEIPAAAWEMIRDWEESSLAKPKNLSRATSQEIFAKLAELLSSRKEELREMAREQIARLQIARLQIARSQIAGEQIARDFEKDFPDKLELVPVIIVDRAGQFRGVEMFEKASDPRGASVLKQVEKTNRFDKKPFQAFLDFGEKSYVVISDLVRRDTVRLQHVTHPDRTLRDADYFIIEE